MRPLFPLRPALSAALVLAAAAALPLSAHAQAAPAPSLSIATPPVVPTPAAGVLPIPMPANTTVQVEMSLSDDDLLGVFKSLLRGVSQGAQATPVATPAPARAASYTDSAAQVAQIISTTDLSSILKGVTHIHVLLLQTGPAAANIVVVRPVPGAKKKAVLPVSPPSLPDQTGFYEAAFAAEGGHRIIYSNFAPVYLEMTSFGQARGFALMAQYPGGVFVMRADGYPDLSALSSLATQIGTTVAKDRSATTRPLPPASKP